MPLNSSRKLADVSPTNRADRIERKASRLLKVRAEIAELEAEKIELNAQLLKLVKVEGAPDDDGKIRYQTDAHQFVVVDGKSTRLDTKKLIKLGVRASIIKKATTETPYQYVLATARKEGDD